MVGGRRSVAAMRSLPIGGETMAKQRKLKPGYAAINRNLRTIRSRVTRVSSLTGEGQRRPGAGSVTCQVTSAFSSDCRRD